MKTTLPIAYENALIKIGLYRMFIDNVEKCECNINEMNDTGVVSIGCISTAFIWDETPEGLNFWEAVDLVVEFMVVADEK